MSSIKTFNQVIVEELRFSPERRSMIFENEQIEHLSDEQVKESEEMYQKLQEHFEKGGTWDNLDEGILGAIVGTITGATIGPKIGGWICSALGITKGLLWDLFNSRIFTTSVGLIAGKRL